MSRFFQSSIPHPTSNLFQYFIRQYQTMSEQSQYLQSPTIDQAKLVQVNKPVFLQRKVTTSQKVLQIAKDLQLLGHQEGGFFKETDRSPLYMENPYSEKNTNSYRQATTTSKDKTISRNYSTLIYYLITSESAIGRLHRNHSRIIHILQKGRGQYVLVYPDGTIKSFIVGFDFANGEVAQWVVPGGVYKASFLLPLEEEPSGDDCLLISEVVVPGFEWDDHRFMESKDELSELVGEEKAEELGWLLG
ncbi:unnamed protein product [Kuraishia capsulata CBS 1993]|uniref:DUF985 domain-containing protein n=1 Tax=Kuraishia capsulata CBS 1993 TaxID=1382522 RepID=W6MMZ7_9ASCO|nr:uncharacterized protein KUCA_T00003571001 [Kuraishia capsulata CBS 1993]CDK27593.1 unnamed protein product [Kuraishia capsulata CBS 1993]